MNEGPEAILSFSVIDENDDYLVVDKPAPLIVHPSNGRIEPTLLGGIEQLLAFERANDQHPAIITRLDRETSGLVLVAKHTAAARELAMALQHRHAHKEYLALVHGWPEWSQTSNNRPIIRQGLIAPSPIWLKRCTHPSGRASLTKFSVEQRWQTPHGPMSLIRSIPVTGRTHQIRVHLADLGFPIVGDKIYGREPKVFLSYIETGWTTALQQELLFHRQALHAHRLRIEWHGTLCDWSCPLANDLSRWMQLLNPQVC